MSENKILKETEKEFKKFAEKVIHRAKFYLKRRKKNTKNKTLSDSLDYNIKVYSSGALELGFKAADYFKPVEEGRKPGKMPPSSALAEWIRIKPIKIRDKKGRYMKKDKTNVNRVAFAIAKSIEMYGIKPTYFFRDAFKMHYKRIDKTILKGYAKDMEKFLKTTLKDNIKTE